MRSRLPAFARANANRTRTHAAIQPTVFLKGLALAILVMVAAPIIQLLALFALGVVTGDASLASGGALVARSLAVQVIQYGTAILAILVGAMAVLAMCARAAAGAPRVLRRSLRHALRSLPRLVIAQLLLSVTALVGVVFFVPVTACALIAALVLLVRDRLNRVAVDALLDSSAGTTTNVEPAVVSPAPSVKALTIRRALLLAIPLAPVVVALGLIVTAIPAALSYPASIRALLHTAFTTLRTRTLEVVALVIIVGAAAAGLTVAGSAIVATPAGADSEITGAFLLITLALLTLVCILLVVIGATFAVLVPPAEIQGEGGGGKRARPRLTGILRHRLVKASPIALITIGSMLIPFMPAASAFAAEGTTDSPSSILSGADAVAPDADSSSEWEVPSSPAVAQTPSATAAVAPSLPTTLDLSLVQATYLGDLQFVYIDVIAEDSSTTPTGTVDVFLQSGDPSVQDERVAQFDLSGINPDYPLPVPTANFGSLSVQLRFVYVPDDATFLGAEETVTANYLPAMIVPDYQPVLSPSRTVSFGEKQTFTFTITSEADAEDLIFELINQRDWNEVTSTRFSIVDGTATVTLDLTGLLSPGEHNLYYRIPATATHDGAESETPSVNVTASPTTTELTFTAPSSHVGDHVQLGVAVTADNGSKVSSGHATFFLNGVQVHRFEVLNGQANWTYRGAHTGGTYEWRVEYSDPARNYQPSRASGSNEVEKRLPSYPAFSWSGRFTPDDAYLNATFTPLLGLPVPTGGLTVTTMGGDAIGSGTIGADGEARIKATILNGTHQYRVVYDGDATWQQTSYTLLPYLPPAYDPVVTLSAPATATLDETITVTAAVDAVPSWAVQSLDVYRALDGGTSELAGRIDLQDGLSGSLTLTQHIPGDWTYTAVAAFDPSVNLGRKSSAPTPVVWSLPAPPQLTVGIGGGPFTAGDAVPVTVTATALPDGGFGVPAGTKGTIYAVDRSGRSAVGTVTLDDGPDGLSGTTTITRAFGGTVDLVASVDYGTRPWTATSSPITLTTAPPVGVLEIGAVTGLRFGTPATFEARFRATGTSLLPLQSVAATVTVGSRTYPVILDRNGFGSASPYVSGRVQVDLLSAGDITATVSVTGDGVRYGTTSASTTVQVLKAPTKVRLDLMSEVAASGQPLMVNPVVTTDGVHIGPSPTGRVTVSAYPSRLSCTVNVGQSLCELQPGAIVAGHNSLSVTYEGDANYFGASEQSTVTGSARESYLTWKSSPELHAIVAGSPTTFSWTVSNASTVAPVGTVEVRVGGASCRSDVAVGRCTLTVPLPRNTSLSSQLDVLVQFTSADDAASASFATSVTPKDCVVITTYRSTVTGDPGSGCRRGDRDGFITGSYVTARHEPVAAPYVFDLWELDGKGASRDDTYQFRVTDFQTLSFATRYAPVCYTLDLTPIHDIVSKSSPAYFTSTQYFTKGFITPLTQPNCTDPETSTAEERGQLENGHPRYAAGTVVDLRITPITTFLEAYRNEGTPYVVDTVTGATAHSSYPDFYQTTMVRDQSVSATFKARDCMVIDLKTGAGGTNAITSSQRPGESRYLRPFDGSCTRADGVKGYVPGSTVTITATPDADHYFLDWRTEDFGPRPGTLADPLELRTLGDPPSSKDSGAAGTVSRTFTVPAYGEPQLIVGANYANVHCVAVTTTVWWPETAGPFVPTTFRDVQENKPVDSLRCGRGSSGPSAGASSWFGRPYTQTDWFVGTAVLQAHRSDPRPAYSYTRPSADYQTVRTIKDVASIRWSVDTPQAVADLGTDGSSEGPVIYLSFTSGDRVAIEATYYTQRCHEMRFSYPQGGAITAYTDGGGEGDSLLPCPENSGVVGDRISMSATPGPEPEIDSIVSVARSKSSIKEWPNAVLAADGRLYTNLSGGWTHMTVPTSVVRLEYCVPFDLTVSTANRSGEYDDVYYGSSRANFTDLDAAGWPELIAHDGGCPPMWARPGSTVTVGLTDYGAFGYDLVDGNVTVAVPTDGTGPVVDLRLRAKCATVTVGDRVSTVNPPNCDWDSSKYVLGSPVQLHADVPDGGRLNSWSGADKTENTSAWVMVTKDRVVTADIYKPNLGEKILNGLSSIAQRTVALAATIFTGILLMEMTLVKVLGLAMTGVSMGLKAVGVSGAGLDGFDRATAIVNAQTSLPATFANCLSGWAHGPSLTQTNLATKVGAPSAVFLANQAKDKFYPKVDKSVTDKQGIQWVVDAIDAYGSGSYLNDAATQWSSMGSSLGSCMESSLEKQIDPIIRR
jgi:hypothetical protein